MKLLSNRNIIALDVAIQPIICYNESNRHQRNETAHPANLNGITSPVLKATRGRCHCTKGPNSTVYPGETTED